MHKWDVLQLETSFESVLDVRIVDASDRVEVEDESEDNEWSEVLLVSHTLRLAVRISSPKEQPTLGWDGQQSA